MNSFDLKSWLVGFVLGITDKPLPVAPLIYAEMSDGVLYIHNARAVQSDDVLEVT